MTTDNDTKRAPGRPPKGSTTRSARLSLRVEPWVREWLQDQVQPGETMADAFDRLVRVLRGVA